MKACTIILLAWLLVVTAATAGAQDLYSYKGVDFEAIAGAPGEPGGLLGMDVDGWIYQASGLYGTGLPLRCYHEDDPEGSQTTVNLEGNDPTYLALMHDGSGVFVLRFGVKTTMGVLRCDAAAPEGYTWESAEVDGGMADLPPPVPGADPMVLVMSPAGEPCFMSWSGLWCGVVDAGAGVLSFAARVDIAEMDALLEPDPGLGQDVLDVWRGQETTRQWRLRTTYWTPDGRHFSIIDVRFKGYKHDGMPDLTEWFGYLVEHGDGSLVVLVGPPRPAKPGLAWESGDEYSGRADPLVDATHLIYSPQLDALLAWPLKFWDWDSTYVSDRGSGYSGPAGPGGVGFYAVSLSEEYRVYLSLTDSLIHVSPYAVVYGHGAAIQLPDGDIGLDLGSTPGGPLFRVRFDLDRLDIDTDGLTWNHEQSLGSSDYWPQSDSSTVADSVEALITGTDPTDMDDDPAPARIERFAYVRSGLIRKYLDELGLREDVTNRQIGGGSIDAPLCLLMGEEIECIMEDRSSRIRFTPETGKLFGKPVNANLHFSQDGDHAVFLTPSGIRRIFFPAGEQELVISAAALGALAPGHEADVAAMRIFPVDEDLLFISFQWDGEDMVWGSHEFFVYAVPDGATPNLVYDHQKARCDSEMGPCDPVYGETGPPEGAGGYTATPKQPNDLMWDVRVAGWFPELDRLLLVAAANWSRYYVALHHEEPPVRLMGAKYFQGWYWLLGMPEFVMPTGHGEYFVGSGFLNGWLSNPYHFEGDGLSSSQPPGAFWGDIMVSVDYAVAGIWELVRYDGWGDPGDVIFMDTFLYYDGLGYYHMMARSGPRGGIAQAWRRGEFFNNPWGMDVRDDGLLCLVDRGKRDGKSYGDSLVHIWEASVPNRIPDTPLMTISGFPDATDCAFTGDNSLYILIPDPPQLVRYEMWTDDWELVEAYPEGAVPIDLVEGPDGEMEVLFEDAGLRGFLYLKDGRRLEMASDAFKVTVDGQEVANLDRLIWAAPDHPIDPKSHTYARFVERPDGLVVAVPFGCTLPAPIGGQLLVFDPNTPYDPSNYPNYWPLTAYDNLYPHEGSPLAVMPGSYSGDPWGPAHVAGPEGEQPALPASPSAPTAGRRVSAEESSGCHAAPAGEPAGMIALLLLLSGLAAARYWSISRISRS